MIFKYTDDQRAEILAGLPRPIYFGTEEATDVELISALEACACQYIERVKMLTVDNCNRKIEALRIVESLVSQKSDNAFCARIEREIERWSFELSLIVKPRQRRARLRYLCDVFWMLDEFSGLSDQVVLSDSNSNAARFFHAAIAPACLAAGEKMSIRQGITELNRLKEELRLAEIEWITAEIQCAANRQKT